MITSLGEKRANLSVFRTFVRFVLVWICRFSLPLGVWEGLQFVTVALPDLFSYLFLGVKGLKQITTKYTFLITVTDVLLDVTVFDVIYINLLFY